MNWNIGTVESIFSISSRVKVFRIKLKNNPKKIIAGQYFDIRLTAENGFQAQRSYSISSSPQNLKFIEFTISKSPNGEVSEYLHNNLQIGDKIEVKGPLGNYFNWIPANNGQIIFFAGGTGISPFMSMIRHKIETQNNSKFKLMFSSRTINDVLFFDELNKYTILDPSFDMKITLTREKSSIWKGLTGRLSINEIERSLHNIDKNSVNYICGPTNFVEKISTIILDLGVNYDLIKTERFG